MIPSCAPNGVGYGGSIAFGVDRQARGLLDINPVAIATTLLFAIMRCSRLDLHMSR